MKFIKQDEKKDPEECSSHSEHSKQDYSDYGSFCSKKSEFHEKNAELKLSEKVMVFTKGAPEILIDLCTDLFVDDEGTIEEISSL